LLVRVESGQPITRADLLRLGRALGVRSVREVQRLTHSGGKGSLVRRRGLR
jgi:hypothetical protein